MSMSIELPPRNIVYGDSGAMQLRRTDTSSSIASSSAGSFAASRGGGSFGVGGGSGRRPTGRDRLSSAGSDGSGGGGSGGYGGGDGAMDGNDLDDDLDNPEELEGVPPADGYAHVIVRASSLDPRRRGQWTLALDWARALKRVDSGSLRAACGTVERAGRANPGVLHRLCTAFAKSLRLEVGWSKL